MTRSVLRWFAAMWIIALIAGSLMPGQAKVTLGVAGARPPNLEHRVVHFVGFVIAELLLLLLATNRRQKANRIIGVLTLGLGLELTQYFILGGSYFEWWDIRDDVIGIFTALLVIEVTGARKWLST